MKMRNTLICTVGTSLIESNLKQIENLSRGIAENWPEIKRYLEDGQWALLARELRTIDPRNRICGAEINTIEETRERRLLQIENLIFLVSDTDSGSNTGQLLRHYYSGREDMSLKNVEYRTIEGLQDTSPKDFKQTGLRNLVREIGSIIERFGRDQVAIDATGGYKAQIAVAVLIGQALDIPVFYKHERFAEIIDFPPMPISLDYDILGRNSDLLSELERGVSIHIEPDDAMEEKLSVFLNSISDESGTLYELNPIGQLYLTSFRIRYPKIITLHPLPPEQREQPRFSDHHYASGFREYVDKIWTENKWIRSCQAIEFGHKSSIKGRKGFYVKTDGSTSFVTGRFLGHEDKPGQFRIYLSNESPEAQNWAAQFLNDRYFPD